MCIKYFKFISNKGDAPIYTKLYFNYHYINFVLK